MKKIFLICPVRGVSPSTSSGHVEKLENDGASVHWPHRDTDQNDDTGFRICKDNLAAIINADEVHFIWDGKSQGCLFDLGMAFALSKKVVPVAMPGKTPHKSFQNMVKAWSEK